MPQVTVLPGGFAPRVHVVEDGVSADALPRIFALAQRAIAGENVLAHGSDVAGDWAELAPGGDADCTALVERVESLSGARAHRVVLRVRRYPGGYGHPPHSDNYVVDGARLAVTGILYLQDAHGGATAFPNARPEPLLVVPRARRLAVWWSEDEDGQPDPAAVHASLTVESGEKWVLAVFLYLRDAPAGAGLQGGVTVLASAARSPLVDALRAACRARSVPMRVVDLGNFRFEAPLPPGSMLYNAEPDARSLRVEQLLVGPGVVTTWADPEGAHFPYRNGPLLLERHGVPIPTTVYVPSGTIAGLRSEVAFVGGFPVVVKFLGGSGGVGVLRADSLPALASLLDLARAEGRVPLLCRYIAEAEVWRVFVVGERAVAAYRNPLGPDGFRSEASGDPEDYFAAVPARLAEVSVAACRALRTRFGGVDVLLRGDELWVLEVNNPAWFGHAQENGLDVAGALVEGMCRWAEGTG